MSNTFGSLALHPMNIERHDCMYKDLINRVMCDLNNVFIIVSLTAILKFFFRKISISFVANFEQVFSKVSTDRNT